MDIKGNIIIAWEIVNTIIINKDSNPFITLEFAIIMVIIVNLFAYFHFLVRPANLRLIQPKFFIPFNLVIILPFKFQLFLYWWEILLITL